MENLKKIIKKFDSIRILVIGDVVLDKYIFATTSRVSREAPVLVLEEESVEFKLGGGGNTVRNFKDLGVKVDVLAIVGNDPEGKEIIDLLNKSGVSTSFVIKSKKFKTPLKTRVLAGETNTRKQQVFRIDRGEKIKSLPKEFFKKFGEIYENYDAIIFSDYGYGVSSYRVLKKLKREYKKLPFVFVDSRFELSKFKEITSATPNITEAYDASGFKVKKGNLKRVGKKLLSITGAEGILITLGSEGMYLIERNLKDYYIPIFGDKNIVDVTGAGDTVMAVFSSSWISSKDFFSSAIISNVAGALTVMKAGASTVTTQELKNGIDKYKDKITELFEKYS